MARLLLLPGMDGTGRMFAPLVACLSPTFEARVISYPGDALLGYAELKILVERALPRDDDYFLLAESFSGPLALEVAAGRPAGLRGVILAASFASSPLSWLPRWSHVLARPWLFGGLGFGPRLALGQCPPAITPLLREALASVAPAVLARRAREILTCEAPRDREALRDVPALVLAARRDRLIGHREVDALQALLPRAQVEWIDAPHLILQARPDTAAEKIATWIASQGF